MKKSLRLSTYFDLLRCCLMTGTIPSTLNPLSHRAKGLIVILSISDKNSSHAGRGKVRVNPSPDFGRGWDEGFITKLIPFFNDLCCNFICCDFLSDNYVILC